MNGAIARRPLEAAISEGNLAENPIFVLHNTDAKPEAVSRGTDGKLDYAEYTRFIQLGKIDERDMVRSITLKANPQFGYPTMFAYRLLLAIIEEAHRTGFKTPTVYITRSELATRLGYKRPSKLVYDDIANAIAAMRTLNIEFKETWYDKKAGERGNVTCEGLISAARFYDDRQASLPLDGVPPGAKRSYVKIGDLLFESLKQNYFHGVDLDYMNALKTPLAQRLYAYLAKKDRQRNSYTEDIRLLAGKLNLKKRAPSAIWDALEPRGDRRKTGPLELLRAETFVEGEQKPRRFLGGWVADRQKQQLTVHFYDEVKSQVEASLRLADAKKGWT